MLIEQLQKQQEETSLVWDGRFHISDISYASPRRLLYIARGVPGSRPYTPTAGEGRLHEDDIIARLRAEGYQIINRNYEFICPSKWEWPIIGHVDGLIRILDIWYLLEIKSLNFQWFRILEDATRQDEFPDFFNQIQLYLWLLELSLGSVPPVDSTSFTVMNQDTDKITKYVVPTTDSAFLIAKNRDTGKLLEYIVPYQPGTIESLLYNVVSPALNAYIHGLDYSQVECGCQKTKRIARWCPYRYFCEVGQVDTPEPQNIASLRGAIQYWKEAGVLEERAESLKSMAKMSFENIYKAEGMAKFSADGTTVQKIHVRRENIDGKLLKQELGEEAKQFIRISEYDYWRVD